MPRLILARVAAFEGAAGHTNYTQHPVTKKDTNMEVEFCDHELQPAIVGPRVHILVGMNSKEATPKVTTTLGKSRKSEESDGKLALEAVAHHRPFQAPFQTVPLWARHPCGSFKE